MRGSGGSPHGGLELRVAFSLTCNCLVKEERSLQSPHTEQTRGQSHPHGEAK